MENMGKGPALFETWRHGSPRSLGRSRTTFLRRAAGESCWISVCTASWTGKEDGDSKVQSGWEWWAISLGEFLLPFFLGLAPLFEMRFCLDRNASKSSKEFGWVMVCPGALCSCYTLYFSTCCCEQTLYEWSSIWGCWQLQCCSMIQMLDC